MGAPGQDRNCAASRNRGFGVAVALGGVLAIASIVRADAPEALDEAGLLSGDPQSGSFCVSWWAHSGKTYFVQHSADMVDWQYFPVIEPGADTAVEWEFLSPSERIFVRMRSSDQPTSDPEGDDFDLDAVSNMAELTAGTDPLASTDLDTDGLPDDWERAHGLDPLSGVDASSDHDGDGLSALEEFAHRSNPSRRDSDKDGLSDGFEALAGTLLNSVSSTPHSTHQPTGLVVYSPGVKPFAVAP